MRLLCACVCICVRLCVCACLRVGVGVCVYVSTSLTYLFPTIFNLKIFRPTPTYPYSSSTRAPKQQCTRTHAYAYTHIHKHECPPLWYQQHLTPWRYRLRRSRQHDRLCVEDIKHSSGAQITGKVWWHHMQRRCIRTHTQQTQTHTEMYTSKRAH